MNKKKIGAIAASVTTLGTAAIGVVNHLRKNKSARINIVTRGVETIIIYGSANRIIKIENTNVFSVNNLPNGDYTIKLIRKDSVDERKDSMEEMTISIFDKKNDKKLLECTFLEAEAQIPVIIEDGDVYIPNCTVNNITISRVNSASDILFLSWKQIRNAESYKVYRRKTEDITWEKVFREITDTSFIIGNSNYAHNYEYCVVPVFKYGDGGFWTYITI